MLLGGHLLRKTRTRSMVIDNNQHIIIMIMEKICKFFFFNIDSMLTKPYHTVLPLVRDTSLSTHLVIRHLTHRHHLRVACTHKVLRSYIGSI